MTAADEVKSDCSEIMPFRTNAKQAEFNELKAKQAKGE